MSMKELEGGIRVSQGLPDLPRSEGALAYVDVVQENDPPVTHLWSPRAEVVIDGLGRMEPIDMEEVHAAFGEVFGGLIEGRSNQARERRSTGRDTHAIR